MLVLDPWQRSSLAAVRALGRLPWVRVGVAGLVERVSMAGHAANSRWATCYDVVPDPAGPAQLFQEALHALIRRRGYDAVVATSDATVARLASIDVPVPTFPEVGPGWHALTDKAGLAATCAALDVPYPVTRAVGTVGEVASAIGDMGLPVVVKSAATARTLPEAVLMARGARVCHDLESAEEMVRALLIMGFVPILQPRIPFVDKVNAVTQVGCGGGYRYAHRVLRELPISGGTGVALETIPADRGAGGEAVDLLARLCLAVGYGGLAQAEFYRSRSDGRLYLVDVNPRLWGSTWFAERLGQRVTERGVRAALSLEAPPSTPYALGRRFRTPLELRWAQEHPHKRHALTALLRDVQRGDVYEFVDRRDPKPLGLMLLHTLTRQARDMGL